MKCIIGIESTAHTFGIGVLDMSGNILSNIKDSYTTEEGGMIPLEVRAHHRKVGDKVFEKALSEAGVKEKDIEAVSFSSAPGLAPCLLEGMDFSKKLAKKLDIKLIGVNHCVAHLIIGESVGAKDPVMLYASGANTQVIAYESKKFRIFGETLDLGVGNFIDTIGRTMGLGFPAGPKIEKLALEYGEKNSSRITRMDTDLKKGRVIFAGGKNMISGDAWYSWISKEIEKKGMEFVFPEFPNISDPVLSEWLDDLDKTSPDENSILIGHSIGGMAIMRWLERMPEGRKVGKVILIAATNPDIPAKGQRKDTRGFYEAGAYDFEKIKSRCDDFVVIHSKDDEWVPFVSGKKNSKGLDAKLKSYEDKGHFTDAFDEVPEVLEEVVNCGSDIEVLDDVPELLELPYAVKGMDVSFSGIQTKIRNLISRVDSKHQAGQVGEDFGKIAYAIQENVFAMLVEVAERALAHTGKKELLIGGGVGCNDRLQEMCQKMCRDRGVRFFCPPKDLLVDNGAMIGYLGLKMLKSELGTKDYSSVDIAPRERTDEVICDSWR